MVLRFVQLKELGGTRILAAVNDSGLARKVEVADTLLDLAQAALAAGATLAEAAQAHPLGAEVDIAAALAEGRVLAPIDHPDPAHLVLTGTGLTHLGSAEGRDKMHKAAQAGETAHRLHADVPDGRRRRQARGRRRSGAAGVVLQGRRLARGRPGQALTSPAFAQDGGEEPEIAGVYLIGPTERRIAWASAWPTSSPTT
jgi:hypothetical protein